MNTERQIIDLLRLWQEEFERGRDIPAAELCVEYPELVEELDKQIQILRRMNELKSASETLSVEGSDSSQIQSLLKTKIQADALVTLAFGTHSTLIPNIPGYEIVGELGRGGMGVVYKARQHGLNRTVALKIVLGDDKADSKQLIRFLAEAEAVASVQHPNVVEVYHFGEHQAQPFLALEFCPGGSLDAKLKGKQLKPVDAAELLARIAEGVHAAHSKGIIHRDIKPQNILLSADGTPKVSDFGLAKKVLGREQTQTENILGTPAYMSPEQASGSTRFVGPETDVWSLGVMLYEMLSGVRPFIGETQWDTLVSVQKGTYSPLRKINPNIPHDLQLICQKSMAREPKDRYATAGELALDLRHWLAGEPIVARPVGPVVASIKWVKRNKAMAGAIAGIILALVTGTVVSTWQAIRAGEEAKRAHNAEEAADKRAEEERIAKEQMQLEKARADRKAQEARDSATAANQVAAFMTDIFRAADPFDVFGNDFVIPSWEKQRTKTAESFVREAAERLRKDLKDQPLVRARLLAQIGNSMKNLGLFPEAEAAFREVLDIRRTLLPRDDPDTITSELDLGRLFFDVGDFVSARDQFQKALEAQKRTGVDEITVATTRFYQAANFALLGHPDAEPILKEVIETRTRLKGPHHPSTLFAKIGRIAFLLDNGRASEVPALVPDVLAAVQELPEGQFRSLCSVNLRFQAAMALRSAAGDNPNDILTGIALRNAEAIIRKSLAEAEKLVPEEHHIIILFRFELAVTLDRLGKSAEADRLLARVTEATRRAIGLAHPKVLVLLETYTARLARTDRVEAARALYDEADQANVARFGPANFWRVVLLLHRVDFEVSVRSYDRAATLAREAIDLIDRGKVIRNRETALSLLSAARSLGGWNVPPADREPAWRLFELSHSIIQSVFGERDPERVMALHDHAHRLIVGGDSQKGMFLMRQAGELSGQLSKPLDHFESNTLNHSLGRLAVYEDRHADAEKYFSKALAISRTFPTAKIARRSNDAMALAGAMISQGRANEAVPLLQEIRQWSRAQKIVEPELATIDRALALAQLMSGNRDDYRASVEAMVKRYGLSTHANTQTQLAWAQGVTRWSSGWDAASTARVLSAVLSKAVNTSSSHRSRALSLIRAGDLGEAEMAIKKAKAANQPNEPIDPVLLGLIELGRGQTQSARAYLREATEKLEQWKLFSPAAFAENTWYWLDHITTRLLLAELRGELLPSEIAPAPRSKV